MNLELFTAHHFAHQILFDDGEGFAGFAGAQAIADLNVGGGQSGINAGGAVEFDGQAVESGDGSGADGGELKGGRMLLVELEDTADSAEMGEDAEGGFAVLAKGQCYFRIYDAALTSHFRFAA